jgi:hypothetical protein
MTEGPILFGDAVVRALFESSKTQMRRVVKLPQAPESSGSCGLYQWSAETGDRLFRVQRPSWTLRADSDSRLLRASVYRRARPSSPTA